MPYQRNLQPCTKIAGGWLGSDAPLKDIQISPCKKRNRGGAEGKTLSPTRNHNLSNSGGGARGKILPPGTSNLVINGRVRDAILTKEGICGKTHNSRIGSLGSHIRALI